MSSPRLPDVEGTHDVFSHMSTGSLAYWDTPATSQKSRFGNMLFVIDMVILGLELGGVTAYLRYQAASTSE